MLICNLDTARHHAWLCLINYGINFVQQQFDANSILKSYSSSVYFSPNLFRISFAGKDKAMLFYPMYSFPWSSCLPRPNENFSSTFFKFTNSLILKFFLFKSLSSSQCRQGFVHHRHVRFSVLCFWDAVVFSHAYIELTMVTPLIKEKMLRWRSIQWWVAVAMDVFWWFPTAYPGKLVQYTRVAIIMSQAKNHED